LKLQRKITEAYKLDDFKLNKLNWESCKITKNTKVLTVKKVVINPEKNTPSIDNIIWNIPEQMIKAILVMRNKKINTP
jgi:hypothetical protein